MIEQQAAELLEVAFRDAGRDIASMSALTGGQACTYLFPNQLDSYGFFAVDLTFRADGTTVLQEANGSNGASRGILADGQMRRAHHMACTAHALGIKMPTVMLLAHADVTSLMPEFHLRMALFINELRALGITSVAPRAAGEPLGAEKVSVVIGSISRLLPHLSASGGAVFYGGRYVSFASNANVLPAMVRAGTIPAPHRHDYPEADVFHEGRRGVAIAMNKDLQQMLAAGTGLTPLRHAVVAEWHEAQQEIHRWHGEGRTVVAKISSGSQGVGIDFFPPHQGARVQAGLDGMRVGALLTYGDEADRTALPIQLFEFAESTPYMLADGGHLWDVRVEVHVEPGRTTMIPATMRVCPAPFDPHTFDRAGVVSNLSGRRAGLEYVRVPFRAHPSGVTELEWAGIDDRRFEAAMAACGSWSERALELERK